MFNGLAVAKNGDIYFSDSSSDFGMEDGVYTFFTNPSRATGKLTVLLDKLWFANGVALSPEEDFVLVAETHGSRVMKFNLKGAKQGQLEVFAEGLPGVPDNITPDADGVWIALVVAADPANPMLPQAMAPLAHVRKFLVRLLLLIEMPFKFITSVYPNPYTRNVAHRLGHFSSSEVIHPARATIVRADWTGKIVGSLHGFDKTVKTVSHVVEFGDHLYLGSPHETYIARVKFVNKEKIHPVKQQVKREVPVTTTAAPPTTTTTTPVSYST